MTRTAEATITTRTEQHPPGTAAVGFRFRAVRTDGATAAQIVSVTTVQFAGLDAGRYTIDVAAVAADGSVIGAAVSAVLDVPETATVAVVVPDTLTVRLL